MSDRRELLFYIVQDRRFLETLNTQDIEYLYKLFKHLNKMRNKNSFFGTMEYLITKGK